MKNILYSFCLAGVLLLASCSSQSTNTVDITEETFLDIYTTYEQQFNQSDSTKTTSRSYVVNTTTYDTEDSAVEPYSLEYTTEYSEVKKDDNTDAHIFVNNTSDEEPFSMDLYYLDGNVYASRSYDDYKATFEVPYDEFKLVYSTFYMPEISQDDILSTEIMTSDEAKSSGYFEHMPEVGSDSTIVKLTLNNESFPNTLDAELLQIESLASLPSEYLTSELSDIQYTLFFDPNGNIQYIDTKYNTNFEVSLPSSTDETETTETSESSNLNINISRSVNTITTIDQVGSLSITTPEDLDSYEQM